MRLVPGSIASITAVMTLLSLAACGGGGGGAPANVAPVASFTLTPGTGAAPLGVHLDGSASSDADGTIVSFAWDFNGDGTFDQTSASPTANFVYAINGPAQVGLRVTDNGGASTTATQTIATTAPALQQATADPATEVTGEASLAIIGGKPAIAYVGPPPPFLPPADLTPRLTFVRALDAAGTSWGPPVVVDQLGGRNPALVEAAGMPLVVYYRRAGVNPDKFDLLASAANDVAGSSWVAPVTIQADTGTSADEANLLIADLLPATIFADRDPGGGSAVMFARAVDVNGFNWSPPVQISPAGLSRSDPTGFIANGRPCTAFFGPGSSVEFMQALDAAGGSWPASVTVIGSFSGGSDGGPHGIDAGGRPCVAIEGNDDLLVALAKDAGGTAWNPFASVFTANSGDVASSLSVASVLGMPMLAFQNGETDQLNVVLLNVFGNTLVPQVIATGIANPADISLADIGGRPAIAFTDTVDTLQYLLVN